MQKFKLKNTIKYPTSLIVNGLSALGMEIAESLLEQGGYVVIVDIYNPENLQKLTERLGENPLLSFLDYTAIPHLEEDLRRLDYIFYFAHDTHDLTAEVSTQTFLKYSNYLDSTLSLAVKFEAKFLLTTLIKSHQLVMDNMDMEVNFGKTATMKHTVYTEMEVQRYSESLCLEYVNKTSLNARIIRLGEIIGQGIDLTAKTPFTSLVLNTVNGESLELLNDGLESDWYVDLADAAYGIIKAQFTKDTVGEMYSLAYDGAVTHLSIAYKIQELEPNAGEITFVEDKSHLTPLRLHKPAPNLANIGWKPKIEFDQALAESLAAAKLFILQAGNGNSASSKLKSFLNIAQQDINDVADDGSPVSRLIAERRKAEMARQASLDQADIAMRLKRKQRARTPGEKFQNATWDFTNALKQRFGFIGNITPTQLLMYVVGFVVFFYLYFNFFSPVIVLARNQIVINNAVNSIQSNLSFNNLDQLYNDATGLQNAFTEDNKILLGFVPFLKIFAADQYATNLASSFSNYADLASGYQSILNATRPVSTYLNRYANNIKFRPASDSYLTVGTSLDYSTVLKNVDDKQAYIESGLAKINNVLPLIQQQNFNYLPSSLANSLNALNTNLTNLTSYNQFALTGESLGELLGVGAPHTYLVFLLDNSKPMPIGGEISAFLLLTVYNGSITEIRLQSIDAFSADLSTLPKYVYDDINLHTFSDKAPGDVTTRDLALIGDHDLFTETTETLWNKAYGRNIDMVMTMNLQTLSDLISNVGSVDVEGQSISGNNILNDLIRQQTDTPTLARRHDLLAQTWAQAISANLAVYSTNTEEILSILADNASQKNLQVSTEDLDYRNLISDQNLNGAANKSVQNSLDISITSDPQIISPTKYAAFSQIVQTTVNDNYSVHYDIVVKFPEVSNADMITACIPVGAQNITVTGIDNLRSKIKTISSKACIIGDIISETEIGYSFDVLPIESSTTSQYNLQLSQVKLPGISTTTDFEISLAPTLKFDEVTPNTQPIGGKLIFTQNLTNDLLISLKLSKK